jgi:hypothetical protein
MKSSVPPYRTGGTGMKGGAMSAILMAFLCGWILSRSAPKEPEYKRCKLHAAGF